MALTNYERQKRWREKNRVIYNLKRRNRRKRSDESQDQVASETDKNVNQGVNTLPTQLSKVDELRQLMKKASAEPAIPSAKPLMYRNDFGQVISETQWNTLQKRKQKAANGGYVIDEYSQ